jgi:hypothetical protein
MRTLNVTVVGENRLRVIPSCVDVDSKPRPGVTLNEIFAIGALRMVLSDMSLIEGSK